MMFARRTYELSVLLSLIAAATMSTLSQELVPTRTPGVRIEEVMAGANGDSRIQFLVLARPVAGENLWGPQGSERQSRSMLVFFDAWGRETGKFKFPSNPPAGLRILIATREFANLPGAPAPDVLIPPLLNALSGLVCFRNNPSNGSAIEEEECLAYGRFVASPASADAPPAPSLPVTGTVSLRRTGNSGRNSDFALNAAPTPSNSAGAAFTLRPESLVEQGRALFENETFSGNGRTCATCHVAADGFALTPGNVRTRFASLSAQTSYFDPLFIGESAPSSFDRGFDFNLNTLELAGEVETGSPCTGDLSGVITTTTGGRAKVLARTGPTMYLVYGGLYPPLEGTVTDGSCSAAVSRIAAGDLASSDPTRRGIEDPQYLRKSDLEFPEGRALILENIDGYSNPPVLRRSPSLLNLRYSAPYGLSGEFPELRSFTIAAVTQHFPRTLARTQARPNPDFRMPTTEELDAIEAFLLAQEFPRGGDPNKFDLSRFATTSLQRKGREDFEIFGCATCHSGPVLNQTAISVQEKQVGANASFNTGTTAGAFGGTLPCERGPDSCGSREFSTPQLFGLSSVGPLFHNGSAKTLAEAVNFYNSSEFATSPVGLEFIFTGVVLVATDAITVFLDGLNTRPYTLPQNPVRFGAQPPDAGRTAAITIPVTNTGSTELRFAAAPCRIEGSQAREFTLVACPLQTPVAAGETRALQVAFDPQSEGFKSAILEIHPEEVAPSGIDLFGVGGPLGPSPRISEIRAQSGGSAGGETLTIQGANFKEGATIAIGGVDGAYIRVVTAATISVRTPPHAPGAVDVEVVNPDGQTARLLNAYTYR